MEMTVSPARLDGRADFRLEGAGLGGGRRRFRAGGGNASCASRVNWYLSAHCSPGAHGIIWLVGVFRPSSIMVVKCGHGHANTAAALEHQVRTKTHKDTGTTFLVTNWLNTQI
jgi:hypothetical protein